MTFENLNLIPPILRALKDENYSEPTSIQAKSIPLVLNTTRNCENSVVPLHLYELTIFQHQEHCPKYISSVSLLLSRLHLMLIHETNICFPKTQFTAHLNQ